jgi:hypothetical protein
MLVFQISAPDSGKLRLHFWIYNILKGKELIYKGYGASFPKDKFIYIMDLSQ